MNRLHPKGDVKSQALFGSEHTQRRGWGKHVYPPNYEVSTVDGVVLLLPNSMCLQIACSALSAQPCHCSLLTAYLGNSISKIGHPKLPNTMWRMKINMNLGKVDFFYQSLLLILCIKWPPLNVLSIVSTQPRHWDLHCCSIKEFVAGFCWLWHQRITRRSRRRGDRLSHLFPSVALVSILPVRNPSPERRRHFHYKVCRMWEHG